MDVRPPRNDAIDCLRGVVMILMALDHTRMFVGPSVDLQTAAPALCFTRWITHFCAPVFVLLAGLAAYLHGRRLGSTRALGYLFTRGLWLAVLESRSSVRCGWHTSDRRCSAAGDLGHRSSMMVVAALVWLPHGAIAAFAAIVIVGHNLLDAVHAEQLGALRWLWLLLHEEGRLTPFAGATWFVIYPLIPWVAVMAAGYVIGPWALLPREQRRLQFLRAGLALITGFVALRATNLYGDPHAWSAEGGAIRGLLSFLDCEKYPPSLLFLAITSARAVFVPAWVGRALWVGVMRGTGFERARLLLRRTCS